MSLRLFIFWTTVIILPQVFSSNQNDPLEEDYDYDYDYTESPELQPLDPTIITQINNAGLSWTAGQNFENKLIIELKMLAGTFALDNDTVQYRCHNATIIPKFFDARQKWPHCPTLNTVPSQGRCSSCWAVIPASVISDRTCIGTKAKVTQPLSAEEYMLCCKKCMLSPPNGCYGGDPLKAFLFWVKKGLVTGGDIYNFIGCRPYSKFSHFNSRLRNFSCHTSCTNRRFKRSYMSDKHYGRVVYRVLENVEQIQMEIMTNGPVVSEMQIYQDFYLYYSGVYVHHVGDLYNLTHSVKILGWGEENNTPYWLAANSWGQKWGKEGGFFKILRGSNHCGIETRVIAGKTKQPVLRLGMAGRSLKGTKAGRRIKDKRVIRSDSNTEHRNSPLLLIFVILYAYDIY